LDVERGGMLAEDTRVRMRSYVDYGCRPTNDKISRLERADVGFQPPPIINRRPDSGACGVDSYSGCVGLVIKVYVDVGLYLSTDIS